MNEAIGSVQNEGVQVVFVSEDGTYRVDMDALQRILSQSAARGLPVCVVSVAGATRGGKSFLLDFFLRYLRAPPAVRRSGAWLGAEDEPLTGFSWRGGCERDTAGIVIWPEPLIVELESGKTSKKVAVVLMDTQGTFDSTSTIRDSSIIFAMSSLLSSVQIYNLFQNIKEDDLQYLQLFTEYGKLAQESSVESPFQVLQFLVRDWSYPYDFFYGADGGKVLLQKRLQITSDQHTELRELREHVHSAFEDMRCYLMPHPGLNVATSPTFRGCVKDISPEFKNSLLDFAPSLFAPENITVKKILGQEITVQDLPQYFRSYIELFNSESLPTPVTVTRALSMASLEAAIYAARSAYASSMECTCGGVLSVSRGAVPRLHAAAVQLATDTFTARRTLASPELRTTKLDTLVQELDAMLPHHKAINDNKITASITKSKATYREHMEDATKKCLLPLELDYFHVVAKNKALEVLDDSRAPNTWTVEDDDDDIEDRNTLIEDLDALLLVYRETNSDHITQVCSETLSKYSAQVQEKLNSARCLHPRALQNLHQVSKNDAIIAYHESWREAASGINDHREKLIEDIETTYGTFVSENHVKNNNAIAESIEHYQSLMDQLFDGNKCLHPSHLTTEHGEAIRSSRAHFLSLRMTGGILYPVDLYQKHLLTQLTECFFQYNNRNEDKNKKAVERAVVEYTIIMTPIRAAGVGEGILEVLGAPDFALFRKHRGARQQAIDLFKYEFRRQGPLYGDDAHLAELEKQIAGCFRRLVLRFAGNVVAQGAGVAVMTGVFFFRLFS